MTQSKPVLLRDVWRTCNKIRAAIFRLGLDLWSYFKRVDPNNNGLVSESLFVSIFTGPLRNKIGLSDQEIGELADYFRLPDGRIFYSQLCDVIHKSVPDFGKNENLTSGLEFDNPLHMNALGPGEERRLQVLLAKIAANVNMRQLILRPYFQDYELIAKSCGTVTIAHFARILHHMNILVSADDFNLLVKKYNKDNYTINYNSFLHHLDEIFQYWEKHGITDLGGDLLRQFPGRLINAELPKLPRPEIGVKSAEEMFGVPAPVFHPVLRKSDPPEELKKIIMRIQKHVFSRRVRSVEFFHQFDLLNTGKIDSAQFRRGLDSIGVGGFSRLYLSEPEIMQLIVFYRDPNDPHRVCWKTFTDDIDHIFTTKELEKVPDLRVEAPQQEVIDLPPKGAVDWNELRSDQRDLCEETLDKIKIKIKSRRMDIKQFFKMYDKINTGHVTRTQFRNILASNSILLSQEEANSLENRFLDEIGFNYIRFLQSAEPENIEEPVYDEFVRKKMELSKPQDEKKEVVSRCERDIVMILAKIKSKTIKERIRIKDFMEGFDRNKEKMISKVNFIRALDQGRYGLTKTEIETIMNVFAAPGRREFVNWVQFCDNIEEAFTQGSLERAPMLVPLQHVPTDTNPRAFLNFEERHLVSVGMEKLAKAGPDRNLDSLFLDYDKCRCGTVTKQQLVRALSTRGLIFLISSSELDAICKAFSFYRGMRDEVTYPAFLQALHLLHVNSKQKPV